MERRTIPDVRIDEHTTRRSMIDVEAVRSQAMEIYWRLKAYEDTGLTPEEANAAKLALMGKTLAEITEFDGVPLASLRELVEADKDHRAKILPCKIGDTVWLTRGFYTVYQEPIAVTVTAIKFREDTCTIITDQRRFSATAIGETVFLNREEAEKYMEEAKK